MINLKDIKNQKFNDITVIKILFCLFPISFIIGNFAVTINLLLFLIIALLIIVKKKLTFNFQKYHWVLV